MFKNRGSLAGGTDHKSSHHGDSQNISKSEIEAAYYKNKFIDFFREVVTKSKKDESDTANLLNTIKKGETKNPMSVEDLGHNIQQTVKKTLYGEEKYEKM